MNKTVLIEQTSKRLKRWELIVTAMLFLTLFAGFGLLYVAIPAWDHIFLPFRNVFPRLHRRPDHNLVVSRINSPQLRLTLWMKSAFLFKLRLVIWNLSCILHFEQFCV